MSFLPPASKKCKHGVNIVYCKNSTLLSYRTAYVQRVIAALSLNNNVLREIDRIIAVRDPARVRKKFWHDRADEAMRFWPAAAKAIESRLSLQSPQTPQSKLLHNQHMQAHEPSTLVNMLMHAQYPHISPPHHQLPDTHLLSTFEQPIFEIGTLSSLRHAASSFAR